MSPKESRRTVYGTIFSFPPPPAPSEALSSSNLIPACLITDPANLTPAPASPVSTKRSACGTFSTRPQPTMKWSLAIQKGTATLLLDDAATNCSSRRDDGKRDVFRCSAWLWHSRTAVENLLQRFRIARKAESRHNDDEIGGDLANAEGSRSCQ